jgi:glycopeptide antibiotics resistance protein
MLFFFCVHAYGKYFPLWSLALVLAGFGLSMEFAQAMTKYRQADGWDILANSGGILVVWLFILCYRRVK